MKPTITQVQSDPYVVYERAGCSWKVFVQQDGNEDQYGGDFRLDWEGTAIFTLLPRQATQGRPRCCASASLPRLMRQRGPLSLRPSARSVAFRQ
jgi:hypothetical protein